MKIVSFSGIDGAGKSTQIAALQGWLAELGLRAEFLTFWDNVVVLSKFREFASHKAFKGDKGIGSPEKPLQRRDKNVTSRPVSAMRFGLYFLDAVNLARAVRKARKSGADVIIFDRYIYDELANLPLNTGPTKAFIRMVLKFVPQPDVAYLIDADPDAAFARKPEYPLEFVRKNREAYLNMARLTGHITVIAPNSVEQMQAKVRNSFLQKLSESGTGLTPQPVLQ
jgi:thymidylate kinase